MTAIPYLSRWWMSLELQSLQKCCLDAEWTCWRTVATLWRWRGLVGLQNSSWSSSFCSKMPGVAQRNLPEQRTFNQLPLLSCFMCPLYVACICRQVSKPHIKAVDKVYTVHFQHFLHVKINRFEFVMQTGP